MSEVMRALAAIQAEAASLAAGPGSGERSTISSVRDAVGNRRFGRLIQAKLAIGTANDPLEREADDVAEKVVRTREPAGPAFRIPVPKSTDATVRRQPDEPSIDADLSDEDAGPDVSDAEEDQIQRKCAACEQEEEEEPGTTTVQAKRQSSDGGSPASPSVTGKIDSLRGSGDPLSPSMRDYFEPRFGRDFSGVRIHTGSVADETSRAINARAFTRGQDLVFRAGAFDPGSDDGRRLIAHELTHVVQQDSGRGAPAIRRKKAGKARDAAVLFSVRLTRPLSSSELLVEFAKQYYELESDDQARAMIAKFNWHWMDQARVATPADVTKGYIILRVTDHNATGRGAAAREADRQYFKRLPGDEQKKLNDAIDATFWKTRNYKPLQRLGNSPDDRRMAEQWLQIRDEMVEQRRELDELPPRIKAFLYTKDAPPLDPAHYGAALRVAKRLATFSDAEFADYKTKINAESTDWAEYEASLARYELGQQVRAAERQKLETTKTKLFGLEGVYRKYRELQSLKTSRNISLAASAVTTVAGGGAAVAGSLALGPSIDRAEADLQAELPRYGFSSIADFEKYIHEYEVGFRTETVAIAFDLLARYEHVLYEGEKKYRDPANVTPIFQALSRTRAKEKYSEAEEHRSTARSIRPDPELHRYMPGEFEMKQQEESAAASAKGEAESEFATATPGQPLMANRDFPREKLANASADDFQSVLLDYIKDRREDIGKTRAHLTKYPHMIFGLDELLKASYKVQEITPGSIYDLIIRDRIRDDTISDIIWKVVIGVIALALGILSFGTGTVAVLAAVGAFGISAYQAVEEYREYEIKSAAYGSELLSDKPEFVWVVVAVVTAGLDLAAAGSAIKAMKPAAEAFNLDGDLTKLEKELQAIAEIDDKLRANTMKAARAELQYRNAIKSLIATSGRLNAILIPVEDFGKLVAVAYHLAKRGVISFERFLLELKGMKLLSEAEHIPPEDLALLKKAFEEGMEKSRSGFLKYGELSDQIRSVYKAEEVEEIALQGKLLGYSDKEIQDFLEAGSISKAWKKKVPLTPDQLTEQMKNWATVVKPRGYPYLFENLSRFEEFKGAVRTLAKKYGLPEGELFIQGSSLRTPGAKDVDIALFVSDADFAKYAEQCRAGLISRAKEANRASFLDQFDKQVADGYISAFFVDRPFPKPATFERDAKMLLDDPFKVGTDISIMKASSKLALFPAMKL